MNKIVILGGRDNSDNLKNFEMPIEVLDTEKMIWSNIYSFNNFRHASFVLDRYAFIYGGCDFLAPLEGNEKLSVFDVSYLISQINLKLKSHILTNYQDVSKTLAADRSKSDNEKDETQIIIKSTSRSKTEKIPEMLKIEEDNIVKSKNTQRKSLPIIKLAINEKRRSRHSSVTDLQESLLNNQNQAPIILQKADIAIVNQFILDNYISNTFMGTNNLSNSNALNGPKGEKFFTSSLIKTISLEEKNKFNTIQDEENEDLYENFINSLLKPSDWSLNLISLDKNGIPKFRFRREHIIGLTKACNEIILSQSMVLKIKTPVKVFGDIHGQYEDLMRFFELWGEPSENPGVGDINSTDYLFLGDYIDRGVNSLETICLLMALKIKYPEKIHLLRGNHEDRLINSNFGFLEECEFRLPDTREVEELNVFEVINEFFDCLPLAAIIDNEILCIHGGLGGCLTKVSEIEEIKRPLRVVHEASNRTEQIVMDILWSDPTDNDQEYGIQPNIMRDSRNYGNIVKFGPDIVDKFLKNNNLSMIIRAHECVLDGFERFDGGKLITVFSATDYCKRHKNAGAMLIINNNFEIIPHLIYPLIENMREKAKKWMDEDDDFKARPPTPLRNKNSMINNS